MEIAFLIATVFYSHQGGEIGSEQKATYCIYPAELPVNKTGCELILTMYRRRLSK